MWSTSSVPLKAIRVFGALLDLEVVTGLGGGNVERKSTLEPDLIGRPRTALLLVKGYVAGTGSNL
jgi:hypothetical protein